MLVLGAVGVVVPARELVGDGVLDLGVGDVQRRRLQRPLEAPLRIPPDGLDVPVDGDEAAALFAGGLDEVVDGDEGVVEAVRLTLVQPESLLQTFGPADGAAVAVAEGVAEPGLNHVDAVGPPVRCLLPADEAVDEPDGGDGLAGLRGDRHKHVKVGAIGDVQGHPRAAVEDVLVALDGVLGEAARLAVNIAGSKVAGEVVASQLQLWSENRYWDGEYLGDLRQRNVDVG